MDLYKCILRRRRSLGEWRYNKNLVGVSDPSDAFGLELGDLGDAEFLCTLVIVLFERMVENHYMEGCEVRE